ncbi:transcriptional regulator domain-containing protein [Aquabacter spiritensis]|uniref:transcriptional regulator domain-containing protein n=1 Tax=Aquabacter spiritensis TaxID=933073 RepID=UPI001FE006BD|nr:DUF6499 domain-containing protein [Aquabacter spiritensis]
MKPDTSRWRDSRTYDYFDDLSVEGLAWECLRRDEAYQQAYRDLVDAERAAEHFSAEVEHRWGLRCPGEPLVSCTLTTASVVAARQSGRNDFHRAARQFAGHRQDLSACSCGDTCFCSTAAPLPLHR